jgi:hypothetical protein
LVQIKQLGLFYEPYHLQNLFNKSSDDYLSGVKLIECAQVNKHSVKHYQVLDEDINLDLNVFLTNEEKNSHEIPSIVGIHTGEGIV